eukprot:TRINITY_DN16802_c0_g1_i1.p1 TRINITY_DN16802_c0_g1~~TRINITY_DN16802_c0_g1_i1.p1  ORF type:complete len:211 (+),score=17.26 TRINITY_DN16802_c0_g1_i1:74-634(+)
MQLRYSSDARESWVGGGWRPSSRLAAWGGEGGGGGGGSGGGGGGGSGADGADAVGGSREGRGGGGGASKRLFLKLRGSSLSAHPDEVRGCDVYERWGWAAACVLAHWARGGGFQEERGLMPPSRDGKAVAGTLVWDERRALVNGRGPSLLEPVRRDAACWRVGQASRLVPCQTRRAGLVSAARRRP